MTAGSYSWADTYTDQDGVVWSWRYARCPRCTRKARPEHRHFTPMTSFLCPHCGVMYDEPVWADAEAAFVTCISDDDARDDPDPEVRRRYREYHGMQPEEGAS